MQNTKFLFSRVYLCNNYFNNHSQEILYLLSKYKQSQTKSHCAHSSKNNAELYSF